MNIITEPLITEVLPASWAPALVNGDWSGLEYDDPDGAARAKAWQIEEGLYVLDALDEPTIEQFDGLTTDCLVYVCTRRH